jgi:hypothetical protein
MAISPAQGTVRVAFARNTFVWLQGVQTCEWRQNIEQYQFRERF